MRLISMLLFIAFFLSLLFLFVVTVHAKEIEAQMTITATVICNCNVNGIIVPNTCNPDCEKLKQNNSYQGLNYQIKDGIMTINY